MKPVYEYKGKKYYIENNCQLKNNKTRLWEEAVVYVSVESPQQYCRNAEEFYERFKKIILIDEAPRQTFWGQE